MNGAEAAEEILRSFFRPIDKQTPFRSNPWAKISIPIYKQWGAYDWGGGYTLRGGLRTQLQACSREAIMNRHPLWARLDPRGEWGEGKKTRVKSAALGRLSITTNLKGSETT